MSYQVVDIGDWPADSDEELGARNKLWVSPTPSEEVPDALWWGASMRTSRLASMSKPRLAKTSPSNVVGTAPGRAVARSSRTRTRPR